MFGGRGVTALRPFFKPCQTKPMSNSQKPRNALKAAELIAKAIALLEEDRDVSKEYSLKIGSLKDIAQSIVNKEFEEPTEWKWVYTIKKI